MPPSRILDETNNLLLLYRHHVGKSEVPIVLHEAACFAGVAAAVEDRVWLEKFKGRRLTPSLYTFMVAPSSIGKGEAIDTLTPYLQDLGLHLFEGMITAEKMMERMSGTPKPGKDDVRRSKIFLIQEELAMCIGMGPTAFNFVKHMTGLYKRGVGKVEKATVTGANAVLYKQNINWLAGTTTSWMIESIPREAIEGGFIGRLYGVSADYDLNVRYRRPLYPPDYDEVRDAIRARFEKLATFKGEFILSKKAAALEEQWYKTRPAPTDPALIPTWRRQHDLVLKFSMNLSLCESFDRIVRTRHFIAARDLVLRSENTIRAILRASQVKSGNADLEHVRDIIKNAKTIQRTSLMVQAARKGLDKQRLDRVVDTLLLERAIKLRTEARAHGPAAKIYDWSRGQQSWV